MNVLRDEAGKKKPLKAKITPCNSIPVLPINVRVFKDHAMLRDCIYGRRSHGKLSHLDVCPDAI
jgi:hypothetical protein